MAGFSSRADGLFSRSFHYHHHDRYKTGSAAPKSTTGQHIIRRASEGRARRKRNGKADRSPLRAASRARRRQAALTSFPTTTISTIDALPMPPYSSPGYRRAHAIDQLDRSRARRKTSPPAHARDITNRRIDVATINIPAHIHMTDDDDDVEPSWFVLVVTTTRART